MAVLALGVQQKQSILEVGTYGRGGRGGYAYLYSQRQGQGRRPNRTFEVSSLWTGFPHLPNSTNSSRRQVLSSGAHREDAYSNHPYKTIHYLLATGDIHPSKVSFKDTIS